MMMLANDSTNVTVFLQYNETYDVTLYANSCGGSLKSDNISINLTLPEYEGTYVSIHVSLSVIST